MRTDWLQWLARGLAAAACAFFVAFAVSDGEGVRAELSYAVAFALPVLLFLAIRAWRTD